MVEKAKFTKSNLKKKKKCSFLPEKKKVFWTLKTEAGGEGRTGLSLLGNPSNRKKESLAETVWQSPCDVFSGTAQPATLIKHHDCSRKTGKQNSKLQNTLPSCWLPGCSPASSLIHVQMETLRRQVKEQFLEEVGDRMKWPVQGAEGSLDMGYATRLAGETEMPHA